MQINSYTGPQPVQRMPGTPNQNHPLIDFRMPTIRGSFLYLDISIVLQCHLQVGMEDLHVLGEPFPQGCIQQFILRVKPKQQVGARGPHG